jgi:hypothetical protein
MSSLPDWLVERAALDEVTPASRERVERADPRELADRIAALRAENVAELAAYPADPAVAQIEARVARETKREAARRRRASLIAITVASAGVAVAIALLVIRPREEAPVIAVVDDASVESPEYIGIKGQTRLAIYRYAGERAELLAADDLVRPGDRLQVRYKPARRTYGVIASIDGAGAVTLHHPAREDAPPEATALAGTTTTLPHAYALDDAPRFERFFFITADRPIDVQRALEKLRAFARRADSDTAKLELTADAEQWSLRLRKPDFKAPTP